MTGLVLSQTINEFHFNGPLLPLATNIGLLVGAVFLSFGCDLSLLLPPCFIRAIPFIHLMVVQPHIIHRKYIWDRDG